jgi:cobalt-zinc-cadmium efflux system protein
VGFGHNHGHDVMTGHAGARHRPRLMIAFCLVLLFFVVELVGGLLSGSLALISDAGHMAADVVALGAAMVATRIATRPDKSGLRSFGSYRAEVFAAGLTVLIMFGVAAYVVIEALGRIGATPDIQTPMMIVVGALGLAVNLVSMMLLRAGAKESLNVKGAYYEVVADAAGSVGVIAAGVLVALTGATIWDTAVALAIGVFVAVRAVVLGRQVLHVLGQHAPREVCLEQVVADLGGIVGVADIHDLHVWTLTSGMNVATAHLLVTSERESQEVLTEAQQLLQRTYSIEHATLQIETAPTRQCHEVTW